MPATRRLGWTIQPTSDCGIERRVTRYETTTTGRAHARPAERPRDAYQAGTRKLAATHTQGRCDVERLDGNRSRAFDRPPGRYGRGRTEQPIGSRYNSELGSWLARHHFDNIDKGDRSRLI